MINPNVTNNTTQREYGLLFYDVPTVNLSKVYFKMAKIIRRKALPVNLSVYIFDWGLKNEIEAKFQKINAYQYADISIVKFDRASTAELERLAHKQLTNIFNEITKKLQEAITKYSNDDLKREGYLNRLVRKLEDYQNALTIYDFVGNYAGALEVLKKMIAEEYAKIKVV